MTSTNRTTFLVHATQCLATTALMAGLAIGAAAVASAEPEWDVVFYDNCVKKGNFTVKECCWGSGGDWNESQNKCQAPAPLQNDPGQTVTPAVLQNPPGQTGAPPVITVPRGPSSGTLA